MSIQIETVNNVVTYEDHECGACTIFYTKGSKHFKIIPNRKFPLEKGDEITYTSIRKESKKGKRYFLVFDIHLTKGNYRKLPKINATNSKIMQFLGYNKTKKGIKVMIGFSYRIYTPKNQNFEKLVTLPLKFLGAKNIPKYNGDLFDYLADLTDAAAPYVGEYLHVKLRFQFNSIIFADGNYLKKFNKSDIPKKR